MTTATREELARLAHKMRTPLASIGFFSNPWLLAAWAVSILLQVCAVYVPFMQQAFHTVPLGWEDWGLILLTAAVLYANEGCRRLPPDDPLYDELQQIRGACEQAIDLLQARPAT